MASPDPSADIGRVAEGEPGRSLVTGIAAARTLELVELRGERTGYGVVTTLLRGHAEVAHLDDLRLAPGATVQRLFRAIEVPVGTRMRGRVVDPLGRPLDEVPERRFESLRTRPLFARGARRELRDFDFGEPIYCGRRRVDLFARLRTGERRLIVSGSRAARTELAAEFALESTFAGRRMPLHVVFVSLPESAAAEARVRQLLADAQANVTLVMARPDATPTLRALAAAAGCALAEQTFIDRHPALLVLDDVDAIAAAWNASPLAQRGDPHAHVADILDRACLGRHEYEGGSLTVVATLAGSASERRGGLDVLEPSTDGALVLDDGEVDPWRSHPVQRFGAPLKGWGAKLVPYREPANGDLDDHDRRVREILSLSARRTPIEEQVAVVYAALGGHADEMPIALLRTWESNLLAHLRETEGPLLRRIREIGGISGDMQPKLEAAFRAFRPALPHQRNVRPS